MQARNRSVFFATVGVLLGASLVQAQGVVPITNPSFESPDVSQTVFPALPFATGWTLDGPVQVPFPPAGTVNIGTGVFPNPSSSSAGHFDNADGAQLAYMFPEDGHSFLQTLSSTYVPLLQYTLTIGLGLATTSPSATSQFEMTLYYVDGTGSHDLETLLITNDLATGLEGDHLNDFSIITDVIDANHPAANWPIGIRFASHGESSVGQWDFDNVRLVGAVPEPGSITVIGAATMVLLAKRRRLS